jgi:hypothetical protein
MMIQSTKIRMAHQSAIAWIACMLLLICGGLLQGQEKESVEKREKVSEKENDERYMVVLTIGPQEAAALRRDGYLRATLPDKFRNRVDSVVLKHPTTFLKKKLVIRDDIDKVRATLLVNIDESIVDRLEYQPVQMKVYQSGFDSITLKYRRPTNRGRLPSRGQGMKPKPNDSPQVFVRLSPENGTTGWIRNMRTFEVETQFGPTKIPLNRIAGIRFNTPEANQVVVISVTGDYLTGTIDFADIVLATRWGDERIPISKMESVTYHRDARFLESPKEAGGRWILTQPAQSLVPRNAPVRFPGNPTLRGLPNSNF